MHLLERLSTRLHPFRFFKLQSCATLCDHTDCQAPLSMGFSEVRMLGGMSCPSTGDDLGIEPTSPALHAVSATPVSQQPHSGSQKLVFGPIQTLRFFQVYDEMVNGPWYKWGCKSFAFFKEINVFKAKN